MEPVIVPTPPEVKVSPPNVPVPAPELVPEIEELSDVVSFITEPSSKVIDLLVDTERILFSSSDNNICNVADLLPTKGVNKPVPVVSIPESF